MDEVRVPVLPLNGAGGPDPLDAEAKVPRWRRQSLIAARKRAYVPGDGDEHLRFDAEAEAAVDGLERRVVRYSLVSLLDIPDEVHGTRVGVLDVGDEVAILQRRGVYCRVLCPDGGDGWIHRMTLGSPPAGSGAMPPPVAASPVAVSPDDHAEPPGDGAEPADDGAHLPDDAMRLADDGAHLPDELEPGTFEEILRAARAELRDSYDGAG